MSELLTAAMREHRLRFMHVGGPVADRAQAVALHTALGAAKWAHGEPRSYTTYDGERGRLVNNTLRISYGKLPGGSVVELVEPSPDDGDTPQNRLLAERPGLSHIAFWCDDVPAAGSALLDAGATLWTASTVDAAAWPALLEAGPRALLQTLAVCYLRLPDGELVELVSTAMWPNTMAALLGDAVLDVFDDPRRPRVDAQPLFNK
jgi:catechol 2,3-dioxygenase-like lactoylglutathione lyase family enzyme